MKDITTLPTPDTPWVLSKNVLNDAGMNGELHLLAPGAELAVDLASPGPLILFVVSGPVTAVSGLKNFILQPESVLHLPVGSKYALRNRESTPAKVLVLSLPPPRPSRRPEDLALLSA